MSRKTISPFPKGIKVPDHLLHIINPTLDQVRTHLPTGRQIAVYFFKQVPPENNSYCQGEGECAIAHTLALPYTGKLEKFSKDGDLTGLVGLKISTLQIDYATGNN